MCYYDTAQICTNGHLINASIEKGPEDSQNFCSECGAETITQCPNCHSQLRGYYNSDFITLTKVEHYCFNCGQPYPWTSSAIEATQLIIQEDDLLDEIQKSSLIESLPDVVSKTQKTKLAVVRFQKALKTAGSFTAEGLKQFAIDFGCELAKKSLGL